MKFLNQIVYTLLFVTGFNSKENKISDVLDLNNVNYDSIIKSEKLILVEYFSTWSHHCKALAPEYELAATTLKKQNIKLAKVDCDVEQSICQKEGVEGYPWLKAFRNGVASSYNGQRKSDAIVDFMKKQAHLSASKYKVFGKVSKTHRKQVLFGVISDEKEIKKSSASENGFVLYKQFNEDKNDHGSKTNEDSLDLTKTNPFSLIGEIRPYNFFNYKKVKKPIAYIFIDKVEDRESFAKDLQAVAKETKGKITFAFFNITLYGHFTAKSLGLKEKYPAFAIQQIEPAGKFPLNDMEAPYADSISKFVKDFLAGNLKPSIKSATAPEKNDGPVKVIVANEFDQIVNDFDKDVLVEFCSSVCSHCKKLEPIYNKLGEVYVDIKNIVISKMDIDDNDLPYGSKFEVNAIPAIKLFKAGKEKQTVDYEGDSTLEDLAKFLSENAVNNAKMNFQ